MSVQYPIRTKKKNLNREKLLMAATTLFSRNGYTDSTLDQVAAEQMDECANCGTIWTAAQAKFKRCSRCKLVK